MTKFKNIKYYQCWLMVAGHTLTRRIINWLYFPPEVSDVDGNNKRNYWYLVGRGETLNLTCKNHKVDP